MVRGLTRSMTLAAVGVFGMLIPASASAHRYYFCSTDHAYRDGRTYSVFGGVAVVRDGYRDGEIGRITRDFEAKVAENLQVSANSSTCFEATSLEAARRQMRENAAAFEKSGPVITVAFDRDYTGGVPSGRPTPSTGTHLVLKSTTDTADTTPPTAAEAEIRRREAAADADLATVNRLYAEQVARQQAEYQRVADENARRQAAYQAKLAQQQAEYRAKVAAQEAETARIRAEWQARVARCKAGDLSACASEATPQ